MYQPITRKTKSKGWGKMKRRRGEKKGAQEKVSGHLYAISEEPPDTNGLGVTGR